MQCVRFLILFLFLALPALAANPPVDPGQVEREGVALIKDYEALYLEVLQVRLAVLEKMRVEQRERIDEWTDGARKVDGKALKVLMADAYRTAELHGLPVNRLEAMFQQAKASLVRADYASLCGGGINVDETIAAIKRTFYNYQHMGTAKLDTDDIFTTTRLAEEKVACEQKHRQVAFEGAYRHYIRALTAATPAEAQTELTTFAQVVQSMNEAEGASLMADAEQLSAEFGRIETAMEVVPILGDVFDVGEIVYWETASGEKVNWMQNAVNLLGLFAPEVLENGVLWLGKSFGGVVSGMWKIVTADSKNVSRLGKALGVNADALQKAALQGLAWMWENYRELTWNALRASGLITDQAKKASGNLLKSAAKDGLKSKELSSVIDEIKKQKGTE